MRHHLIAALLAVSAGPLATATPAIARCRVGVEVRTIFDATRTYGGEARPVRLVLWYPASSQASQPVTRAALVGADWISSSQPAPGWDDWTRARRQFASRLEEMRSPVAPARALAEAGCGGWHLPPRPGRWPVVVIGSGLTSSAHFHSRLAEELADAGFVVAYVSVLGPAPGTAPGFDAATVRLLADDAVLAIRALADDPRADTGRVALVSWSVAGLTHLAVAQGVAGVRAAVSLDSGVGYDYGPRLWPTVGSEPVPPLRYLHLRAGVRGPVATADALLGQLGAESEVVPDLTHAQFTDLPWTAPRVGTAQTNMRRRVRDFLLAHVR